MKILEIIKPYLPEIITFIAGASAWGYERNKRKQDLKTAETQNHKSIMELYQEALTNLKTVYDRDLVDMQLRHNTNLKDMQIRYDQKFKDLENRYTRLKAAFESYKKNHEK
jgi:hypothetical protein